MRKQLSQYSMLFTPFVEWNRFAFLRIIRVLLDVKATVVIRVKLAHGNYLMPKNTISNF